MNINRIYLSEIQPHLRIINLYHCTPGFRSGTRRLYDHYFLYVHKGCGEYIMDGKTYAAVTGDMFFCPPGTENTIIADEKNPFILSGINFDFVKTYCNHELLYPIRTDLFNSALITEQTEFHDFSGFPPKMGVSDDASIRLLILDMIRQFNSKIKYWDLNVNGMLQTFISKLLQHIACEAHKAHDTNKNEEMIQFISSNYNRDITNIDIAREFHYSTDYINKLVYAYTGMTIRQYILDLRMRQAIHLLLNTNMDITNIAYEVGFSTVHYFSRIFARKTGLSPSCFRNYGS